MTRGRPQRFEMETALDAAESVFRAKGFSGAGVTEVMAAMGLGAGSFYAAFASKSELYQRVLDRAAAQRLEAAQLALAKPDCHAALMGLLAAEAHGLFRHDVPGCVFALSGAQQWPEAARCWRMMRGNLQRLIGRRCQNGRGEGAEEFSKLMVSILDALAMQAASGGSKTEALRLAQMALANLDRRHQPVQRTRAA